MHQVHKFKNVCINIRYYTYQPFPFIFPSPTSCNVRDNILKLGANIVIL